MKTSAKNRIDKIIGSKMRADEGSVIDEVENLEKQANVERSTVDVQPPKTENAVRHIYVHIPFCARICPY
ncbi:MAG: hypothetical protein H0X04_07485, partial [Chthoniobacterales bacterium]|nr:hypothetical protein [Chthoniobacterales bacterium]